MEFKQIKPRIKSLLSFLLILLCFVLSACGGGESSSGEPASGTGSIHFNLVWEMTSQNQIAAISPSAVDCDFNNIDTVEASVTNASSAVIGSASWPCSAHQGTITNVAAGTGITLTIVGRVGGNADWQGQVTGITVNKNQDTNVGEVAMSYIGFESLVWDIGYWDESLWN